MNSRRTFLKRFVAILAIPAAIMSAKEEEYRVTLPKPVKEPKNDLNYDALLWAIAEVETGNKDHKIGPAGERSRYQIKEVVWKQHRPVSPFYLCRGNAARSVASEHIAWLEDNFPMSVYKPEWSLSLYWNAGPEFQLYGYRERFRNKALTYANRVTNLYQEAIKRT